MVGLTHRGLNFSWGDEKQFDRRLPSVSFCVFCMWKKEDPGRQTFWLGLWAIHYENVSINGVEWTMSDCETLVELITGDIIAVFRLNGGFLEYRCNLFGHCERTIGPT